MKKQHSVINVLCSLVISLMCFSAFHLYANDGQPLRIKIDLSGKWQVALDSGNAGLKEDWVNKSLYREIRLPGSLDENSIGAKTIVKESGRLTRNYLYIGLAWFKKEIIIPENWAKKCIKLIIERSKVTRLWVDGMYIGSNNRISVAQIFDLTGKITPGKHSFTIAVDNTPDLLPLGGSHAYSEDTQTNWNGILGEFCLEASDFRHIEDVQVYPNTDAKNVTSTIALSNVSSVSAVCFLSINLRSWNTAFSKTFPEKIIKINLKPGQVLATIKYNLGAGAELWSAGHPVLYELDVNLLDKQRNPIDVSSVNFGMRKFSAIKGQFYVNNTKTFLRGKHDGCVFPLTGYPPMDTTAWIKLFRIAEEYGINHYRFHTWCPPEAAFQAADVTGMYLQVELPNWKDFTEKDIIHTRYMKSEGLHILNAYGNHPSFVLFSLGNELFGSTKIMKDIVSDFRLKDPRHLYAQGSNIFYNDPKQRMGDDYWVTMRTGKEADHWQTDIRGSFSFADSKDGGFINAKEPSTITTYTAALAKSTIPVIGHEVGQYGIYPDFNEITEYTGVLKPYNLEMFREGLKSHHMLNAAPSFLKASGALAVICYREEIETALRTPGASGFQLLDLQDYPGQGTALVGILNAFMESKGIISPDEFKHFCNNVVPLLIMEKYCWTNDEIYAATVKIANYSERDLLNRQVSWTFTGSEGNIIKKGEFYGNIKQGELNEIGHLLIDLNKISAPQQLLITIRIENTDYCNSYPVWIYPKKSLVIPLEVIVADSLDARTISLLTEGKKVLLFPYTASMIKQAADGLFTNDFWNFNMFKAISQQMGTKVSAGTLGIYTNPHHPVFDEFPTQFHTNWQWWHIIKNSRSCVLDDFDSNYAPIIQVIDNPQRNHKLGILFEFSVGKGKLLVCTSDLPAIRNKPEARQFYQSILDYMASSKFKPDHNITVADLKRLFD